MSTLRQSSVMVVSACAVLVSGCRCSTPVVGLGEAVLVASPQQLELPAAWLGQSSMGEVTITNSSGASAEVSVSTAPPFFVEVEALKLGRGDAVTMRVRFTPGVAGPATGLLRVGALEVPLTSEGKLVPACLTTAVCRVATFNLATAQCEETHAAEATRCDTRCLAGTCVSGQCIGALKDCADDGNACTVEACDEVAGCRHLPKLCPQPAGLCRTPTCDPAAGCSEELAADGTLCGPDDCSAAMVDVCILGQCVQRARPTTGQCANRWVPATVGARNLPAMAFDTARQRVVLFGGAGNDTWEWDGARWSLRMPAQSPPALFGAAMAYDEGRQRTVLFGGEAGASFSSDTWEWDGTTWTHRATGGPPGRTRHSMAWDVARQRVLLSGGQASILGPELSDTWEWSGTTWIQRTPSASPPDVIGMATDPVRGRVLLLSSNGTWEWSGGTWSLRAPAAVSPSGRGQLVTDPVRQRVLFVGGPSGSPALAWEWDGLSWMQRVAPVLGSPTEPSVPFTTAWDGVGRRVLLLASAREARTTWTWDGTAWRELEREQLPGANLASLNFDGTSSRLVAVGFVSGSEADTWEWSGAGWLANGAFPLTMGASATWDGNLRRLVLVDGARGTTAQWSAGTWSPLPTPNTPNLKYAALAWDAARRQVVLFGGSEAGVSPVAVTNQTWAWDGGAWARLSPSVAPEPRSHPAMAYDGARQRVVLFGGLGAAGLLGDTWTWDGIGWSRHTPAHAPPARRGHGLAYDPVRQRVILAGSIPDTWEWDGVDWVERLVTVSPPTTVAGSTLTWDESEQRITCFDGVKLWRFLP